MFQYLKQKLEEIGVDNPDLEAKWICAEYPDITDQKAAEIIERRKNKEPLSRIFGHAEFYGRKFYLNEDTLDPRADSEILIDEILKLKPHPKKILDLGTGTGCLLITLLCEIKEATGVAVDLSHNALKAAEQNAILHACAGRIQFIQSNWFENIEGEFDVILSNPPYIETKVLESLGCEVKNFDPILALDGGDDGLDAYKIILNNAKKYLAPQGKIFFEIGFNQASCLTRLVEDHGATLIQVRKDYGGNDRVVEISFGDNI